MFSLKEDQIVPTLLLTYNRVKTYRAHLTEEDRFALVKKKMLKEYGLTVATEDLSKVVEVQENLKPQPKRPVRLLKRNTDDEAQSADRRYSTALFLERKRDGSHLDKCSYSRLSIVPQKLASKWDAAERRHSTAMLMKEKRDCSHYHHCSHTRLSNLPQKEQGYRFKDISAHEQNAFKPGHTASFKFNMLSTKNHQVLNSSKIPKPIPKTNKEDSVPASRDSSINSRKGIFDRLYDLRAKPCPATVKMVQHVRKTYTPQHKQPPKTTRCTAHEPPSKRRRYSTNCLKSVDPESVFERLYAERKQLNTKKLTDAQKRELYLKKQREEMRKHLMIQPPARSCTCGNSLSTESATSDFDINDFLGSGDGDNNERTLTDLNDSAVELNKNFGVNDNIFSSTIREENYEEDGKKIQMLLADVMERFNQHMSLCAPVDVSDYVD